MAGKLDFEVIGRPRRRVDGRAKVTGQTRFADDMSLPRMLHCRLLRSPHPHATVHSIDASRALAHPGVHLVLTGADFPIGYGILPVSQDEHPLAPERVRYVGDPVAAVIAKDEQTATQALELIEVEYRPLKTIATPQEALENPEPRIHDYGEQGNIHRLQAFEFGDVEEALANSEHVFEDVFFFEGNTHLPIEQQAALATVDGDGKLTIWSSTQVPHYLHRAMARVLRMPGAHIRVIACPNGGGFGGKTDIHNHELVVAKAALLLGRPVKVCLNREEVFYMHRGRHPVLMKMRTGVTRDGKLTGDAPADPAGRRRIRQLRHREHLLHRRAADGHLRAAALPLRGLPHVHQQAALRTQARTRHAAAAFRTGGAARQDRAPPRPGPRADAPADGRQAGFADRQLAADRHDRSGGVHPPGGRDLGLGRQARQAPARDAAWASPAAPTCAAPGCRSTGTGCRTRACSCCSIAAAR